MGGQRHCEHASAASESNLVADGETLDDSGMMICRFQGAYGTFLLSFLFGSPGPHGNEVLFLLHPQPYTLDSAKSCKSFCDLIEESPFVLVHASIVVTANQSICLT